MQLLIHYVGNETLSEMVLISVLSCKCEEALLLVFGCYFWFVFNLTYKHDEVCKCSFSYFQFCTPFRFFDCIPACASSKGKEGLKILSIEEIYSY